MNDTARLILIRAGKTLLLMIAGCWPLVGIMLVTRSLQAPYLKDLRQGYLLALAMAHGVNPYLPLPELAKIWLPEHPFTNLFHPTPHTFAVGWLCLPLTLLRYEQAVVVWLIFQLGCLALSIVLLLRILGFACEWRRVAAISFLAMGWWPLILELLWGQLNLCLLVLFLLGWQALRQGKDWMGGTLLGSLLLLKLAGWPIVLWLAFKRRWRAVWAAGLFCAGGHLLAIGLHGWGMVRDYYLKVGPQVSALYRVRDHNLSVWTIGQRLFGQSGHYLASTPLWESPLLVKTLTLLVPVIVLALALRAALRARRFDTAFALLMAIGIALSPIAWPHYLLLAAPALALLLRRLSALRWPRRMTCGVISLLISLSLPQDFYVDLAELFSSGVNAAGQPIVPGLLASLALIPTGALCLLLWLLARLESREERQTSGNSDASDLAEAGEGLLAAR